MVAGVPSGGIRMKILQVSPYFAPYLGGQERHVQTLSRKLIERGHKVTVLTTNYPKGQPPTQFIDGIRIIRVPVRARVLRNPIAPAFLKQRELFEWADVVHVHNEHSFSANAAAHIRRRVPRPMVLTCHGQLRFNQKAADAFEQVYSRSLGLYT